MTLGVFLLACHTRHTHLRGGRDTISPSGGLRLSLLSHPSHPKTKDLNRERDRQPPSVPSLEPLAAHQKVLALLGVTGVTGGSNVVVVCALGVTPYPVTAREGVTGLATAINC